jgi:hypothetical protein
MIVFNFIRCLCFFFYVDSELINQRLNDIIDITNSFSEKKYCLNKNRFNVQRSDVITIWGEPLKEISRDTISVHDAELNKIYILTYKGVEFKFYHLKNENRDLLYEASVYEDAYGLKNGIKIGIHFSELKRVLGKKYVFQKMSSSQFIVAYQVDSNEGYTSEIAFFIERKKIKKIVWTYLLD